MKRLCILLSVLLFGCRPGNTNNSGDKTSTKDKHSLSRPEEAIVKHLDLDLKINFGTEIITGIATWTIENPGKANQIILDTRDLIIDKVTTGEENTAAKFELGKEDKILGSALKIAIQPTTTRISIWYRTSKDAAALQWLDPQQTAGNKLPFLFTQSEAILARTWIPCQDSPGVRFTYSATVHVPPTMLALMSAQNPQEKSAKGVYTFKQSHPIPSYLMALAVGDLVFKAVDNRTGVYAEPATIEKAAWEFADMGKMVDAAEKIYGLYKWGRYDVLVLPPSFPFGGMENPMLTFATPTVISGDRSLVSLIAHELAHSWSGNYVTNATWNDFWLNEGFTTYFERRIVEVVFGEDEAKMQEYLGFQALQEEIDEMGSKNPDTRLKAIYDGRDPDEGVTDIAYEKGYFFLKSIEEAVGRQRFDSFLNEYFEKHAFQSVTTEQFLADLQNDLIKKNPKLVQKIAIRTWVYQPGIPTQAPRVTSAKFEAVDSIISEINKSPMLIAGLKGTIVSANERLYFLKALPSPLNLNIMKALDAEFGFTNSGNAEIQTAWYTLAIQSKYEPAYPNIEKFLIEVGRRKFLMPLYAEMSATPEGKERAKTIYRKARPNYHSVAYHSIDELLKD